MGPNINISRLSDCCEAKIPSINGKFLRVAIMMLGLVQTCILIAIYQAKLIPSINVLDIKALNIYLSHTEKRKAHGK